MSYSPKPQNYTDTHAELYSRVAGVEDTVDPLERSINVWLRKQFTTLPDNALVGDFGCGDGRLLPMLRGGNRKIIGVDISRAMLSRIAQEGVEPPRSRSRIPADGEIPSSGGNRESPASRPSNIPPSWDSDEPPPSTYFRGRDPSQPGAYIISSPANPAKVGFEIGRRREVFVEALLEQFLPLLAAEGVLFDVGVSSFNAVCFTSPKIPLGAITTVMRPGGVLFFTSNAFVESSALPQQWSVLPVQFSEVKRSARHHELLMFRHVLHTLNGPVPLQDHVHFLHEVVESFPAEKWAIEECLLFPPEGCEHIRGDDVRYVYPPQEYEKAPLLEPGGDVTYCKVVVRARRRSE